MRAFWLVLVATLGVQPAVARESPPPPRDIHVHYVIAPTLYDRVVMDSLWTVIRPGDRLIIEAAPGSPHAKALRVFGMTLVGVETGEDSATFGASPITLDTTDGSAHPICAVLIGPKKYKIRFRVVRSDGCEERDQFFTYRYSNKLGIRGGPQVVVDGGDSVPPRH